MKFVVVIFICCISFCCNAQEWRIERLLADELNGTKEQYILTCHLNWDEYFKCVEGEWDSFTIKSAYSIDYELEDPDPLGLGFLFGIDSPYIRYCVVKIGLYDKNSNLVKAYSSVRLDISDKDLEMASLKNSEIARDVLFHLFKTTGYVRILIPRSTSEKDNELIIPHFTHKGK